MNAPIKPDIERMSAAFETQRAAFGFDAVPSVATRRAKLKAIASAIATRRTEIVAAISEDFGGRSETEINSAEIALSVSAARYARKNLARWARPKRSLSLFPIPGRTEIQRQPKGVIGVISPWNYPFMLAVIPAVEAIAAGNRVMIKPSELTPRTSELLRSLFADVFAPDEVSVITGGADVGQAFSQLPFDHLFFTGSTTVGRLVGIEAAKNLTPVTLELGGKSPCVMLPDAKPGKHAKLAAFGRFYNAGQTCVAPDYLLVPKGSGRAYADALLDELRAFYPDPINDPDYTSIISERHYGRLTGLIDEVRAAGATVLTSSTRERSDTSKRIAPTIVLDPPLDSALMREEIFGPILPIIEYQNVDEAAAFINARAHPLALYVFDDSTRAAMGFLGRTTSGGAMINGSIAHLALEDLPFGGVGQSGFGAYHGERGFAEFSHERSVLILPQWPILHRILTPPYTGLMKRINDWMIGG